MLASCFTRANSTVYSSDFEGKVTALPTHQALQLLALYDHLHSPATLPVGKA